jgi:WS/DGAT/MGAT family acyltransferase
MRSRLHVSPVFTQKIHRLPLDFDYPYWVEDDSFELLYHVREQTSPDPGDWEGFCDQVAEFHSQPLDREHPLWEMTLFPQLIDMPGLPANCFAILGKFHHVAIDGATGVEIIRRIHDSEDGEDSEPLPRAGTAAVKPGLGGSLYRAAIRNLDALDKARKLVSSKFAASDQPVQEPASAEEEEIVNPDAGSGVPQTLFNRAVGAQKAWDSRTFEFEHIKKMRKLVPGATINDVLLAISAGGLRRYLEQQNGLPEKSMKAGCPINIRTEEEAQAGGNMISAMIVSLHTNIEDPIERLEAIRDSSRAAKASAEKRGSRKVLDLTAIIPAQTQALLGHMVGKISGMINRAVMFNCPVSNLPGPQQPLALLGGTLHTMGVATPVMSGFGLFIGLCTCAGKLSISMSSAANIMPRIQDLGDCMEQSFAEFQGLNERSRS